MSTLIELQQRLGYHFRDESLLRLALTHPSVAHENAVASPHNQRLEFLGDSLLGLVLSHALYQKTPGADEGALTQSRAKLVNARSLSGHGRALDLGSHLILSRGEEHTGGRERPSALADAFEALLGAVFLDGGFEAARAVILREFSLKIGESDGMTGIENPKGELQELLQSRSPHAPEYQLVGVSGAAHAQDFECAVLHGGVELARGRGKSKKIAESEAAVAALQKLRGPSGSQL